MIVYKDKPLMDTWHFEENAGSWGLEPDIDFQDMSIDEMNNWLYNAISKFIFAFKDLAIPKRIAVSAVTKGRTLLVKQKESHFLVTLKNFLNTFNEPIYSVEIDLDIFVYVRTENSPDKPVLTILEYGGAFLVWGGPEGNGEQCFCIEHTLFCQRTGFSNNSELWRLNHPRLKKRCRDGKRLPGNQ